MNNNKMIRKGSPILKLGIAGGLLLIVAVVAVVLRSGAGDTSDYSANAFFQVARGPLTINVTETGSIKAREQIILKSEVEGRTTILYLVPEGTEVKKGDLLVELDATDLVDQRVDQQIKVQNADASYVQARENLAVVQNQAKSDVDKAELDLRFAKEDLNQYIEGEYPKELKEAEAKINLASEELQRATDTYKWSKVLYEEKYLSQTELKADELSAKKAELDLQLAIDNRNLLTDFTYERQLAQLQSDESQYEMALERTKRSASADVVQAEANLRAKESEFNQQKDKLAKLEEQISKAKIYAPTDGLVVYATSARASWHGNDEPLDEGSEVREREELIYLPTADSFMAEVKVHESNLDKIKVGLPVRVTVDAIPGQVFMGRISKVAPLPDAQSMFMNPDLKIYSTEINLDNGEGLRTGMSCLADIIVEQYEDALYIPVQSVVRVNGQPTVFFMEGGKKVPHPVEIGLDNNRMVRVTGGLKEGQKVLMSPPLDSGTVTSATAVMLVQREQKEKPASNTADVNRGESKLTEANASTDKTVESSEADNPAAAREQRPQIDPEQAAEIRERFRNMTPEEREKIRQQFGGAGGRGGERRGPAPAEQGS